MFGKPSLTWCVLRHTFRQLQHYRGLTSLYETTGKWESQLRRESMLAIEAAWKHQLQEIDGNTRSKDKVIHPMGFDAFGLPAENAAIERGLHPKSWTYSNIETMKQQLENLCCNFDWDRELTTCDPSYYRWTQYIFLKMYEAGLVYQKKASVNWDPVDKTVLADEQIDATGRSWRSGSIVEQRYLNQWYIRTTAYAKSLWDGLETVRSDLWKDVVDLQKNWIGQCTGCRLDFQIQNGEPYDFLSIFTDHPEAIYGISHIIVPASHLYNTPQYHTLGLGQGVGTGPRVLTVQAVHPLTGDRIPIVVAASVARGAEGSETSSMQSDCTLGIPALSSSDLQIAQQLLLKWQPVYSDNQDNPTMTNSYQFDGMTRSAAAEAVMHLAQSRGFGGYPVSSRLHDWLISRQRYWGTPIPIIHCSSCGAVPVPYEDLPVGLPDTSTPGHAALLDNDAWHDVKCPRCGCAARRETDTMDTFVDSSWYFLRYLDNHNLDLPFAREVTEKYMPVDLYIGGIEHAYLHLYYARFFSHFLHDKEMCAHREPFVNLLTQGMVKGESYKHARTGVYLRPDLVHKQGSKYVEKATGDEVIVRYEKMSKSKYNGVDPEELFAEYGADMTRLCILSNVAPKSDRNWNNDVYVGVQNWLNRVWSLIGPLVEPVARQPEVTPNELNQWDCTIKSFRNKYLLEIRYHMDVTFLFNTAIARMHEMTSDLKKVPQPVAMVSEEYKRAVRDLVVMIAPSAPMFSLECWSCLQGAGVVTKDGNVLDAAWPEADVDAEYWLKVQINKSQIIGKVALNRDQFDSLSEENVLQFVRNENFYPNSIRDCDIVETQLSIRPRWTARVSLMVPGFDVRQDENAGNQKKKQNKKKGKKVDNENEDVNNAQNL
ncbi:leucine--tRNA ligase, mitochondrial-like isoform X2 [Dreissena polymorpha]|uniref:leucine--tRNA ligase, mitochondrial-like isoform X2 n=1 Tax=Dreissena polymorpha TaxID=45954 RepID=UPI002264A57F|nr:leucine--tRNA ligase, mitochondrial-like isoform X2 [Dreissena polymorpha]